MTNTESDTMKTLLQSAKDNGAYVTMSFDDDDKLYPSEITFHSEAQLLATFNAWSAQQNEGWKLVPIEPSKHMLTAAHHVGDEMALVLSVENIEVIYTTLLSASPLKG